MTRRNILWLFVAILVVGRVAFFMIGPPTVRADAILYLQAGQSILHSGELPQPTFQAKTLSILVAPIMALFGSADSYGVIVPEAGGNTARAAGLFQLLQLCADAAMLVAIFVVFRRFARSSLLAGAGIVLLLLLQPITAGWTNWILPDTLTMATFVIGLCLFAAATREGSRRPSTLAAVAGLSMGVAGVLRVDILALAVILLAIAFVLMRVGRLPRAGRLVCVTCLGFVLPIAATMVAETSAHGDPRYIIMNSPDNPSLTTPHYHRWTRSWIFTQSEFQTFVLGEAHDAQWPGYDVAAFPARAFASDTDRKIADTALKRWKTVGYDATVDAAFARVSDDLARARPLQKWIVAPALRVLVLWPNHDGGAAIKAVLGTRDRAPVVAISVLAGKILILLLAGIGGVLGIRVMLRSLAVHRRLDLTGFRLLLVLCGLATIGRTMELWVLNLFVGGASMETRYLLPVWPCVIIIALYGYVQILEMVRRRDERRRLGLGGGGTDEGVGVRIGPIPSPLVGEGGRREAPEG
jgi:hypothetical protein